MKLARLKRYTLSAPLLLVLLTASACTRLEADTVEPEVVYGELMCNCSCNQILGVCSHLGCPNAIPMRAEVDAFIEDGMDQETILSRFADKYGLTVLAAPPTAGWFNIASWLMPFFALAVGLGLFAFFAMRFRKRWSKAAPALGGQATSDFQQRLEDELADFIPED
jgi:cytochrome c-type biogenesis protein CcmH/NrfF